MCKQKKRSKIYNKKGEKEKPLKIRSFSFCCFLFTDYIFSKELSTEVIVHDRRFFYAEAIQHSDNSF